MKEFVTKNGQKRVVINCASMREVMELKKEILTCVKNHKLGIKITGSSENLLEKEISMSEVAEFLKNTLISMDISDSLEAIIYKCLAHCTYDTTKQINEALFDTICPESREDYYEIIMACIEENLRPFMKSLISAWSTIAPKLGNIQALDVIVNNANL